MTPGKRLLLILLAALTAAVLSNTTARAAGRMYSVVRLDKPASAAFPVAEPATGTVAAASAATAEIPTPALTGQITAAAIFYEGALYDIPREQLDLIQAGGAMALSYRGKTVGQAAITQDNLYPCCDQPLAALADLTLKENLGGVTTLLAVAGDSAEATRTYRAQISLDAVTAYQKEYQRVGQIGLKKYGVAESESMRAQPAEFAIVQPASGAPVLVAGSLVVSRPIPECAGVYNRAECVRHAFFMVARHEDKSLIPVSWSYADGDNLLASGWEYPVDVIDADLDGDADLLTQVCDLEACSFRIYAYHEKELTLVFRGTRWTSAK